MSFFDKLSANGTNAFRTVSQKVKNSNDISKLTSEINAEKKNIQEKMSEIGRKYYEICKDNPGEEFQEFVDAVQKSEQRIAELQKEIEVVRAREPELVPVGMVCPNCNSTYPAGSAFCAACGQKLNVQYPANAANPVSPSADTAVEAEETKSEFCPYCGEKITLPGQEFCSNCGQAL